jgi:hypothetical protein
MRLPALIRVLNDNVHCSMNCQLLHFKCCTARGYTPDQREVLKRDGPHLLRTEYCLKKASNSHVKIETCPRCGGQCEGETYSFETTCTQCGCKFVRVEDQDEHYLQDAQGYLKDHPDVKL